MLWNVLTPCRLKPVALAGDLKQGFLQIRINEDDRDSFRFHWIKDREILETVVEQFTRLFRLSSSPSALEGIIKYHLGQYEKYQLEAVMELKQSMYVDDVIGGRDNMGSAKTFKKNIVKILTEAGFKLHKWHSIVQELEEEKDVSQKETDETYAKQQLSKGDTQTTILEISWNKQDDQLEVKFPQRHTEATKREYCNT